MIKSRANHKVVGELKHLYLACARKCIQEHWTCARYIAERDFINKHYEQAGKLTHADAAQVWGYREACFMLISSGPLLEWRLGWAEIADGTYPDYRSTVEARPERKGPTHGAHVWKGTMHLFSAWLPL